MPSSPNPAPSLLDQLVTATELLLQSEGSSDIEASVQRILGDIAQVYQVRLRGSTLMDRLHSLSRSRREDVRQGLQEHLQQFVTSQTQRFGDQIRALAPLDDQLSPLRQPGLTPGQREQLLLAEGCVRAGRPKAALAAFQAAGIAVPARKFIACGDACLERGIDTQQNTLEEAQVAYDRAQADIATSPVLVWGGDRWAALKKYSYAFEWYRAARSREKLMELGEKVCVEEGNYPFAKQMFDAAGATMPRDLLIRCGDKTATSSVNVSSSIQAYAAAQASDKLVSLGDKLLEEGQLDEAIRAYEAAHMSIPVERLIECGDRCARRGNVEDARRAYQAAVRTGATSASLRRGKA